MVGSAACFSSVKTDPRSERYEQSSQSSVSLLKKCQYIELRETFADLAICATPVESNPRSENSLNAAFKILSFTSEDS